MTAALEDVKILSIEEWKTLNTASAPTKLESGQSPNMKNVWVDEKPGSLITAPGYQKVGTLPSNLPPTFCINYFKTSTGTQLFVVSDGATVWTTTDFQNFTSIITGLTAAFILRGLVVRDKLWLTNGSDAVRTFDGTTVTVLDGTAGTPNVPRGRYIAYHDERVWLYHIPTARSLCAFSALTDASANIITPDNAAAWPSSNTIEVSEGDADFGTGLILYRGYLHFFKQNSIWRLVGYDEYTYTRVKTRASTGTRFNESLKILDSLVHLIGIDGLYVFDGEETNRISDIIDPSSAEQSIFGFNQLQQPLLNEQFWQSAAMGDWLAGICAITVLRTAVLTLTASDNYQSDFQAGPTQTNIDTTTLPGFIQLTQAGSGVSSYNGAFGSNCILTPSGGSTIVGQGSYATDGDLTNACGFNGANGGTWGIAMTNRSFTQIILRKISTGGGHFSFTGGGIGLTITSVSGGGTFAGSSVSLPPTATPTDYVITFAPTIFNAFVMIGFGGVSVPLISVTEIEIYATAFNTTGKFVSQTLDLTDTPTALGNFNAAIALNGETAAFFTQSSADGLAWDAETAVTLGGAIRSTPRRYLRWGVNFTSDGLNTPLLDDAWLPSLFESPVHDTGGNIYAWGPFEVTDSPAGNTIRYYYRGGTNQALCLAAAWIPISPSAVLNMPIVNRYVQFKIEFAGGSDLNIPSVISVTVNWIIGSATQTPTLQNVASQIWRNRYWLSAAQVGSAFNNVILIRGKKTYGSPWQIKDWSILSFCIFQDSLYGCSSVDGSIFLLDMGFNKAGAAMDSLFETGDYTFGGFYVNLIEVLVEVERKGTYSLAVGISTDRGVTYQEKQVDLTPTGIASYTKRLNFNITTDRFRIRTRINAVDQPFQVHRMTAIYEMEAARGSVK